MEEEAKAALEPSSLHLLIKAKNAKPHPKLKSAIPNLAQSTALWEIGQNGPLVTRPVVPASKHEPDLLTYKPNLAAKCVELQAKAKAATLNHAQLIAS